MITLDAGVVIAHLSPHDPHHRMATAYLRRAAHETFLMHPLNLAEVLVGGVRVGRGQDMLADLDAMGIQVAQRPAGEPLRLANLRVGTRLRMPDCCALDTALTTGSTLATFDDALAAAARRHHLDVAPDAGRVPPPRRDEGSAR